MANNSSWDDETQKRQESKNISKSYYKAYHVAREALTVEAISPLREAQQLLCQKRAKEI